MSSQGKDDLIQMLLMALTTAFWGGSFVAGKIALRDFPPMTLTFFRFLIATAIILPYMWIKDKRHVPDRKDIPLLFGLGFLGVSGYFAFQFTSLVFTSAANSSTINALVPLTSSVIATYLTDEKLTARRIGLIALALLGVMLTITKGDIGVLTSLSFNKGDLIMLLAMICFSFYGVFSKRATAKYSPILVTGYVFLFGFIQITPLMLMENVYMNALSFSAEAWAAIVFMAICSSVLGYLIQQVTIMKLGVNKTTLFHNLVPLFAIVFAYFILGDPISYINLVSAGIIITAVVLNARNGS